MYDHDRDPYAELRKDHRLGFHQPRYDYRGRRTMGPNLVCPLCIMPAPIDEKVPADLQEDLMDAAMALEKAHELIDLLLSQLHGKRFPKHIKQTLAAMEEELGRVVTYG